MNRIATLRRQAKAWVLHAGLLHAGLLHAGLLHAGLKRSAGDHSRSGFHAVIRRGPAARI